MNGESFLISVVNSMIIYMNGKFTRVYSGSQDIEMMRLAAELIGTEWDELRFCSDYRFTNHHGESSLGVQRESDNPPYFTLALADLNDFFIGIRTSDDAKQSIISTHIL